MFEEMRAEAEASQEAAKPDYPAHYNSGNAVATTGEKTNERDLDEVCGSSLQKPLSHFQWDYILF